MLNPGIPFHSGWKREIKTSSARATSHSLGIVKNLQLTCPTEIPGLPWTLLKWSRSRFRRLLACPTYTGILSRYRT